MDPSEVPPKLPLLDYARWKSITLGKVPFDALSAANRIQAQMFAQYLPTIPFYNFFLQEQKFCSCVVGLFFSFQFELSNYRKDEKNHTNGANKIPYFPKI